MQASQVKSYSLSVDTIKDIPFDQYDQDFTFIVNGKEYKTSRIVADFLSPTVRKLHSVDGTIAHFTITTKEQSGTFDFSSILSLMSFGARDLSPEEARAFFEVMMKLGNKKESVKLAPAFSGEITVDSVFDRIKMKIEIAAEDDTDGYIDFLNDEIEFIARHFFEIDPKKIQELDGNVIARVIGHEELQADDEDSILRLVLGKYEEDERCSFLFEKVIFVNVGKEGLERFFAAFDIEDLNGAIWRRIWDRVASSEVSEEKREECAKLRKYREQFIGRKFKFDAKSEANGIIRYLTSKTGGNIHDNGTINVTYNRCSGSGNPKNLLDFNDTSFYCGNDSYDVWVCFDFKNMKVNLTNYSIRTINSSNSRHHLKSWVIETSDDNSHWTTIDEHTDCPTLDKFDFTGTFDVGKNSFSRYIRLRQTSKPWGSNHLWFHYIEFYGYLQE